MKLPPLFPQVKVLSFLSFAPCTIDNRTAAAAAGAAIITILPLLLPLGAIHADCQEIEDEEEEKEGILNRPVWTIGRSRDDMKYCYHHHHLQGEGQLISR